MIETLDKDAWKMALKTAETGLKQALIDTEVWKNLGLKAEAKIKEFEQNENKEE